MLTQSEFEAWCEEQKLSQQAQEVIKQIRTSNPSRRVGGGRKNVSGLYPSKKMGVDIQFESHKVELCFIYQREHDEDVLEFYDQPPPIKLTYESASGKTVSFLYTPDFFVIRTNGAEWVECKTESELKQIAQKSPNRLSYDEDRQWRMMPAQKYAQALGFAFRVWSDAEINWILQRNLIFLEDYYKARNVKIAEESVQIVCSLVSAQPGITLAQLKRSASSVDVDDTHFLIAKEQIYIDLTAEALVEPERCFVFRDQQTAAAYKSMVLSKGVVDSLNSSIIDLIPGISVDYNGCVLRIALVGKTQILLQTEDQQTVEFDQATFIQLINQGKISGLKSQSEDQGNTIVREFLARASIEDLERANQRYRVVSALLDGEPVENIAISQRTLLRWKIRFLQAQQRYGYGYLGLLPSDHCKGNRTRKLPEQVIQLIEQFITDDYEICKQKRKLEVYGAFVNACLEAGLLTEQIPSYKTFRIEIKSRSGYNQTLKRQGHRAAYSQQQFYWELSVTTPRHGERPFEIGHIDHTELDIELRCSRTGRSLGRPWGTFLVDAYSRRILAIYITFDPPSYRSCMMLLRICVKRHGRIPQTIVVDNGKEFYSTYFQTLIALFDSTLKYRPPSKARFNSVGERLFGTACTQLLYNLAGNTQITKTVRLMTKSVNPKNLALWTLGLLYLYLCEWGYEIYDTLDHPALGQNPREAFADGITTCGNRSHRMIAYDANFRLVTLPTTQRGRAKIHSTQGVQIKYLHYWSNLFRDPELQNQLVDVRYDPFDVGVAYAYVCGQWVECISEYYSVFQGRSEKEILLASAELIKRHQNHSQRLKLRAKHLAEFLSSAEAEEVLLSQRLRDGQSTEVFRIVEAKAESGFTIQPQVNTANDKSGDWHVSSSPEDSIDLSQIQTYAEY